LKIFLDIGVGEAAIVQMDKESRWGDGSSRKKGANRFKDHLVFGFQESVLAEGLDDSLTLLARGILGA
jgi:hypothetical protein